MGGRTTIIVHVFVMLIITIIAFADVNMVFSMFVLERVTWSFTREN